MTIRFEVIGADGGVWDVHLGPGPVAVELNAENRSEEAAQYTFILEARWLEAVLTGQSRWEELLLSLLSALR